MMYTHTSVQRKSMLISSGLFPLISSRLFSYSIDLNRVKLISAIDNLFNEEEWKVRGLLPFRKNYLQRELLEKGNYKFDAIDYLQYKKSDMTSLHYDMVLMEESLGYLWLIEWESNGLEMITIYKCGKPEDLLLLMAISKVILSTRIVYEGHPNISRLNELKNKHYGFLNRQQNVQKVVKIDLTYSMYQIPKDRILEKLECFQQNGILYNLLHEFLVIPIYDGKTDKHIPFQGIPLIGEITKVLMHHIWYILIDLRLEAKYPGITYTRLGPEMLIVIKESDSFEITESDIKNLLEEEDIKEYHIDLLNRDSYYILPVCNEEKGLMLDEYGDLEVWKYEDI